MLSRRRIVAVVAGAPILSLSATAFAAPVAFGAIPPERATSLNRLPRDLTAAAVRRAASALNGAPAAVTRFHVEGGIAGQPEYDAGQKAQRDLAVLRDLAIAWRVTGEGKYLDAVIRWIDAWTAVYRVSLNPVDEECFERVVFAADLAGGELPARTRAGLDRLFRTLSAGYLDFIEASGRRALRATDRNNWNSHRVKIATLAGYATGDEALGARARAAFDLQVLRNIAPDGRTIDFDERDALHYVVYTLLPLATACAAARAHGETWLDRAAAPAGATVRRGLAWLMPFIDGDRQHEEFVNSRVPFDAKRAAAGVEGFKGVWQRERALDLMAMASHLDPAYRAAYARLALETRRQASDWVRILFG